MHKVLWITGASGTVGYQLVQQALFRGTYKQVYAFVHKSAMSPEIIHKDLIWSSLDIGDRTAVQFAASVNPPDIIINSAAMTNVDACELQRSDAEYANINGPQYLAEICRFYGAHLIHISTDYIFSGNNTQPGPYCESALSNPINYYGYTKLRGEQVINEVCNDHVPYTIVRTASVYGFVNHGRPSFVTWLVHEITRGKHINIDFNQYSTPTLVDDLANILLWMAERSIIGIYHAAGPDFISRYDWALLVIRQLGLEANLVKLTTIMERPRTAPRPYFAGLRSEKLGVGEFYDAPLLRGIAQGLAASNY